eukprot:scaffold1307_cov200-Pinguiococcus_pyrenoidosus.AAC.26
MLGAFKPAGRHAFTASLRSRLPFDGMDVDSQGGASAFLEVPPVAEITFELSATQRTTLRVRGSWRGARPEERWRDSTSPVTLGATRRSALSNPKLLTPVAAVLCAFDCLARRCPTRLALAASIVWCLARSRLLAQGNCEDRVRKGGVGAPQRDALAFSQIKVRRQGAHHAAQKLRPAVCAAPLAEPMQVHAIPSCIHDAEVGEEPERAVAIFHAVLLGKIHAPASTQNGWGGADRGQIVGFGACFQFKVRGLPLPARRGWRVEDTGRVYPLLVNLLSSSWLSWLRPALVPGGEGGGCGKGCPQQFKWNLAGRRFGKPGFQRLWDERVTGIHWK